MNAILKLITSIAIAAFFTFVHDGPRPTEVSIGYGLVVFFACLYLFFILAPWSGRDEVEILEEHKREPEDPEEILP